jgi:hypothetical protein
MCTVPPQSQPSEAVTQVGMIWGLPQLVVVIFPGQLMLMQSFREQQLSPLHCNTVTVKLQLAVLPRESEAVLVTVVVPSGNGYPEGGTLVTITVLLMLLPAQS